MVGCSIGHEAFILSSIRQDPKQTKNSKLQFFLPILVLISDAIKKWMEVIIAHDWAEGWMGVGTGQFYDNLFNWELLALYLLFPLKMSVV